MKIFQNLLLALIGGTLCSSLTGGLAFRLRAAGQGMAFQPLEPFDAYFLFCGLPGAVTGLVIYHLLRRRGTKTAQNDGLDILM